VRGTPGAPLLIVFDPFKMQRKGKSRFADPLPTRSDPDHQNESAWSKHAGTHETAARSYPAGVGRVIMSPQAYITTSWDDGHRLDFRVAELLTKYRLRGTFYVPTTAPKGVMTTAQMRELSTGFEIGAHTQHHAVLTRTTEQDAWDEIAGAKSWVENNTGTECPMFCAPEGRFATGHIKMVQRAGYLGLRSVELLSLDFPRRKSGIMLLPTTMQAYPHGAVTLARNAIKRMAFPNLWRCITHGGSFEWPNLARSLLRQTLSYGGVFHLWGHSWELEEAGQWQRLDETLRFMSEAADKAPPLTNGQLCRQSLARLTRAGGPVQQNKGREPDIGLRSLPFLRG
jgi:peptidoglycan-N-acetylglucosamine deacetylase